MNHLTGNIPFIPQPSLRKHLGKKTEEWRVKGKDGKNEAVLEQSKYKRKWYKEKCCGK